MRHAFAATVLGLALVSQSARADAPPGGTTFFAGVVPVTTASGDPGVVELALKLERLIANDLARSTKRRVAPYEDLLRLRSHGFQAFAPDEAFDAAAQAFGRGLLAFRALDYAKALTEFSTARSAFEARIEGLHDYTGYLRTLTYQLLAATTTGDTVLANDAATRLFTVRPNFKPEAGLLVAAARAVADAARARVAATRTGQLVISSSPSNAVVFLNGERRDDCRTLCTLQALPLGSHAVAVALDDHAVERRRVDVAAGKSAKLKPILRPDAAKLALRALRERLVLPVAREDFTGLARKMADAVNAGSVVVGALAARGKLGRGLRIAFAEYSKDGVWVAYGEVDADLLEGADLAEKLRVWLEAPPRSERAALQPTGTPSSPSGFDFRASLLGLHDIEPIVITPVIPDTPKVYERWWFWTTIGAVVAGGVVTILATKKTEPIVGPATNTIVLSVPP